jgi:hypothetical protein
MPYAAPRAWKHVGCHALTTAGYCEKHASERTRDRKEFFARLEKSRPNAKARGYGERNTDTGNNSLSLFLSLFVCDNEE